jgi:hypothetical protein
MSRVTTNTFDAIRGVIDRARSEQGSTLDYAVEVVRLAHRYDEGETMALESTTLTTNLLRLGEFIEKNAERGVAIGILPVETWDSWRVALEWGTEAGDSPMIGAAAYGTGETLAEALDEALKGAGA